MFTGDIKCRGCGGTMITVKSDSYDVHYEVGFRLTPAGDFVNVECGKCQAVTELPHDFAQKLTDSSRPPA